jgi:hypothetical protein
LAERNAVSNERPAGREETSDELLGQLAHQVAHLVRSDVELAAAEHGPQLRQVAIELAIAVAAAAALLLAFAAASWSAIDGLTRAVPSWSASLIVAAAWAAVAGLLLRHDHPRRLLRRLTQPDHAQAVESAQRERRNAEQAVKETAERFGRAVAREAAEREIGSAVSAAERAAATAEHGAEALVKELIVALLAPGRAGISMLERIVGRKQPV